MWFDIIKIGVPRSQNQKKRYNNRLIRRFLEQIPNGEEFTVKDIIQFWESPEQQEYSTEYRPESKSLGHLLKRTPFRISVVKNPGGRAKTYVKGKVSESDAEKRAEQFIIDTANTLDYVTIENRIVKIKPNWLMDEELEYYAFKLDDIHTTRLGGQLCIYKVFLFKGLRCQEQLCLSGPAKDNPVADNYVTVMLMAGHQNQWESMWKEE